MLEYVSLAILLCGLTLTFYAFIYIHDIPYDIAKHRNHPQAEAIYVACWLSLFTLHAIWPIVFIWAISKTRPDGSVVMTHDPVTDKLMALENRLADLEKRQAS